MEGEQEYTTVRGTVDRPGATLMKIGIASTSELMPLICLSAIRSGEVFELRITIGLSGIGISALGFKE